ncbi:unnamed protein product [Clavelina lepadiformis]|uniref:CUB domain-containing protein n=1 Tax=Clavelina lepadiformis TaxID=159417 RepID=A0ABP0GSD6_CLALP
MMTSALLKLTLIGLICAIAVSGSPEWHNDPDGGVIRSPNYPGNYPNNQNYAYVINAPKGYIVVLTMKSFITDDVNSLGDKTDYLKIYDGRKNQDPVGIDLYGTMTSPYRYISNNRRVRMKFISDANGTFPGFSMRYDVINRKSHCDLEGLAVDHGAIDFCNGTKARFATQCTIHCDDGYQLHGGAVTHCLHNYFTQVHCQLESPDQMQAGLDDVSNDVIKASKPRSPRLPEQLPRK